MLGCRQSPGRGGLLGHVAGADMHVWACSQAPARMNAIAAAGLGFAFVTLLKGFTRVPGRAVKILHKREIMPGLHNTKLNTVGP